MIDLTGVNPDLWREIVGHCGDVRKCFNCSTCVSGCPAAEGNPPLFIRNLVRKVLLGLEDSLLEDETPWLCVTCSSCEEMCPMGVRPFEVCLAIRRWQSRNDETYIPAAVAEIFQTGHTQALGQVQARREAVGLDGVPPTIVRFPEMLRSFRNMLRKTDLVRDNEYMFRTE
jgi:heterodisulfide reductase subunit C